MKILMRLFIFLIFGFSLFACSLDVSDDFHFVKVPASDIIIPVEANVNSNCEMSFKYHLPNGCYEFYDIDYVVQNDTIRLITPFARVKDTPSNCTEIDEEGTFSFRFTPTQPKTYVFKFWAGTNLQGDDLFEEFELETD